MDSGIVDPLSLLAPLLRVRPSLDDFCRFGGDWASPHAAAGPGWAHFHIVTRGACMLDRPGHGPLRLEAGDVLLLPHGDPHVVRARAGSGSGRRAPVVEYRNAIRIKASPGVAPDTELICGRLHFEAAPQSLVVAVLPEVVVLRATDRLHSLLEGIRDELDLDAAGAAAVAADFASALFVMLLRAHLEAAGTSSGALRLLSQPATMRAVMAMLREPARNWSLDELAGRAVSSRATLVRAFRAAAGVAPLAFLTELRLGLARQQLLAGRAPIAQIAADVGYQSEGALSRAFHRHYGTRPGALRTTGG